MAVAADPRVRVAKVGGECLAVGTATDAGDADHQRRVAVQAYLLVVIAKFVMERLPRGNFGKVLLAAWPISIASNQCFAALLSGRGMVVKSPRS